MLEKDLENLIAFHPEEFFPNAGFKLVGQQVNLGGCRADLVFDDKYNRKIIVEVKRGLLTREASGQIMEYYGLLKQQNPLQVIELILCANIIPSERKLFLENAGIECKEIDMSSILKVTQKYNDKFIEDHAKEKKEEVYQKQNSPTFIKEGDNLGSEDNNIWIFQGNPKEYKIVEALSNRELNGWRVVQHRKKIKIGDTALIWISGESAGIYAVADIVTNPGYMPILPEEEKYYLRKEEAKDKIAVELRFPKYLLENPIYRYELRNTPGLENLSILKCPRPTNFPVNRNEWDLIRQKIVEHSNKSKLSSP